MRFVANAMPPLPADLIVFERGWLSSNNLLCLGDEPAVIDTGHVKHAAGTVRQVAQSLAGQPLAAIAHTHLHSDHCGGTGALQQAWPSARTWVPQASLAHVQAWDETALSFEGTAQRCARFGADHALAPGQTVRLGRYDWEIHAAPGHDALAVLLHEPTHGVLVTGDALWEHGVGVIFPHIDGTGEFETFNDTLALIERIAPRHVVPGHGAPFDAASGALAAALARARHRITQFQADPARHALYAARVLLKYQLLDAERMSAAALEDWLAGAPTLHALHRQHRPGQPWREWVETEVLAPLVERGALRREGGEVLNGRA